VVEHLPYVIGLKFKSQHWKRKRKREFSLRKPVKECAKQDNKEKPSKQG
jgi:hypothetical protein